MNSQEKQNNLNSKIFAALGDIAKELIPGLPWHIKAYSLVLIILAFFILGVVIFGGLGSTYKLVLCVCFIALVVIIVRDIWSDKMKVRGYPKPDLTSENTIDLGYQLKEEQKRRIREMLMAAAKEVAKRFNLSSDLVRSNLFGRDRHDRLRMITDLSYQMNHPSELTIEIPVGYGSTGRCFKTCQPNIAVKEDDWGKDVIEDAELRKVHPDLKWIISVPVLGRAKPAQPIWVMNVDGLVEMRHSDDLRKVSLHMLKYSEAISLILGHKPNTEGGHGELGKDSSRQ